MNRDGATEKQVRERISNQISDSKRLEYADFEIQNENNSSVIEQVLAIDVQLKNGKN